MIVGPRSRGSQLCRSGEVTVGDPPERLGQAVDLERQLCASSFDAVTGLAESPGQKRGEHAKQCQGQDCSDVEVGGVES